MVMFAPALQAFCLVSSIALLVPERPRVLASFYRYQATANCVFFTPIFYVYYEDRIGLALSTILRLFDVPLPPDVETTSTTTG